MLDAFLIAPGIIIGACVEEQERVIVCSSLSTVS